MLGGIILFLMIKLDCVEKEMLRKSSYLYFEM